MASPDNTDLNPQGGVQGTSSLYKFNSSPNTRSVLSQKVRILTPAYGGEQGLLYQIGVVSSFDAGSSTRSVTEIRGVGFGDQIAELVPGVTDVHTISIERALLYLSNGHQAFGYAGGVDGAVRTLQQHRWPFDVEQQMVFSTVADKEAPQTNSVEGLVDINFENQDATGSGEYDEQIHKALITYFEGCWITDMGFGTVSTDGGIISQNISASVTDVHDLYSTYGEFMATGNDPTIEQGASIIYDSVTRSPNTSIGRGPIGGGAPQLPPAPQIP